MKRILKRLIISLIFALAVLGAVVGIIAWRSRKTDSYAELKKATLPLVRLIYNEEKDWSNELHGYVKDMQLVTMRGLITPLTGQHTVKVRLEETAETDEFSYQIRNLDGSRLVENGPLSGLRENAGGLEQTLQFSNLVEAGEEYQLIILCKRGEEKIRYYSRIIYLPESHTDEIIGLAHNFRQASCEKNTDFIVNYISPDDTMRTDDFSTVSQHSRSGMITWQSLTANVNGRLETEITELSADQAAVTLRYPLTLSSGEESRNCMVTEQYVIRRRNDVLYLLSFERNTVEDFSGTRIQFDNGNIYLGITDEDVLKMESPDGKVQAFIYSGQLLSYGEADGKLTPIFTFLDGDDDRSSWNHHRIRLTRVENSGDVFFIVYGYQNRGGHEGEVGISFCRFNARAMNVDELFFVPVDFSEDILEARMGTLAYVNDRKDLLYLLYGDSVYSVDLTSGEKARLAGIDGSRGVFFRNEQASLIGWEEYDAEGCATTIHIADLSAGKLHEIRAQEGEFLLLQGFMDRDVVYGVGRREKILTNAGEVLAMPLDVIRLAEVGEEIVPEGEYSSAGYYIEGTEIFQNQIEVRRLVEVDGNFLPAENDQIFLNDRGDQKDASIVRYTDGGSFLRLVSIRIGADSRNTGFVTERVKFRDTGASYVLDLEESEEVSLYYTFARGGLTGAHRRLSDAIAEAFGGFGLVTDTGNRRIWARVARDTQKKIGVNLEVSGSGTSLIRCIRVLAAWEGGRNSAISAMSGESSVTGILSAMLPERSVLNLHGCTLNQILYYLNLGHPVLALTGEEQAVLLTGYDAQNLLICDPSVPENPEEGTGPERTVPMAEAEAFFAASGNQFFSVIE